MWKLKVLIQFLLSRLPFGEQINHRLQQLNGSHNLSRTERRVLEIVRDIRPLMEFRSLDGLSVVEIGTGWDAINPLLLHVLGVKSCQTFDHLRHVRFEHAQRVLAAIDRKATEIAALTAVPITEIRNRVASLTSCGSLDALLTAANITYCAPGDGTRTNLPSASFDLFYSYAVLEHVPRDVVVGLTKEAQRLLKPSGTCFHLIGLHDHYAGFDKGISKVNFLQYSEQAWAFFVYNNIAYHNRLRAPTFVEIFESCGARIERIENEVDSGDLEALSRMKVDEKFRGIPAEQLAVTKSAVVLSFG
jgi:hypothetical protein